MTTLHLTIFSILLFLTASFCNHAHNGKECTDKTLMIDSHGCPDGIYYDSSVCTGVMLDQIGSVWKKDIVNITYGNKVEVRMIIQEPNNGLESFDATYNIVVRGRVDDSSDWTMIDTTTRDITVTCKETKILCEKEIVFKLENSSYSTIDIAFSFVTCERPDLINAVFFEFQLTNCTSEVANVTNILEDGIFTQKMLTSLELAGVVVFGLIFIMSLSWVVYRRNKGRSSFTRIAPTISFDPYGTVREYNFAPRDTALGETFARPMDPRIVKVMSQEFASSPMQSPVMIRRVPSQAYTSSVMRN